MWIRLMNEFLALAGRDDSSVMWTFDPSAPESKTEWSWLEAPKADDVQSFDALFALAGENLRHRGPQHIMFPAKLLAQPSATDRWFAALRHVGINVDRMAQPPYRTEGGMIRSVAVASSLLCRKLAGPARGRSEQESYYAPTADFRELSLLGGLR